MAGTLSNQARSVRSYHDELWQTSWGENDTIAAIKEELSRAVKQEEWASKCQSQLQTSTTSSFQLPGFRPVGVMMAQIPGMQFQVPALVFTAQLEQEQQAQPVAAQAEPQQTSTSMGKHKAKPVRTPLKPLKSGAPFQPDPRITSSNGGEQSELPPPPASFVYDGELPSVGSEGHADGSCKRCAFFPKGRCRNGKDCAHCHFTHELRPRLRKRTGERKSTHPEGNFTPEGSLPEEEECLSELLSYLTEPAAPAQKTLERSIRKDGGGEAIVNTFNTALQEVVEAYMTNSQGDQHHKIKEADLAPACDQVEDTDVTPSTSACSDREDAESEKAGILGVAGASKKRAPSESSDSDISSQEAAPGTPRFDQSSKSDVTTPSPTSWRSSRSNRQVGLQEECTTADVARRTRSLLNKLTEERFESLCSQLLSVPLSSPEQLAVVVAEIFLKATTQDGFRPLYTELCMRLDAHLAPHTGTIGGKAFRKALVNECQATFERTLEPPDASLFEALNEAECFELEMKLKTRRLGNMRFIGDLLVRRLLAPKLLPPIVHELLNRDASALESLIALLTVVGPGFETNPSVYCKAPMIDAFTALRRKMDDKTVCSRIQCQIKDLLEAKSRGWAPRAVSA